jgi:regulatory protein
MPQSRTEVLRAAMSSHSLGAHGSDIEDSQGVQALSPAAVAQGICLRLLTARSRSRAELTDALRRRGIPEEIGELVLDRLSEIGLVDDIAFAEAAVYSGHSHRGLGKQALSTELRRRGVPDEIAREAVATVGPDGEEQRARELIRHRLRTSTMRNPSTLARRLSAMLVRKGYSEELAWRVVRDELGPGNWPTDVESCPD